MKFELILLTTALNVQENPYFPVLSLKSQGQIEILRGVAKFSKSLVHKENYEKCYIF